MGSYALIKQALLAKQPIRAWYKGQPREMCPHVLGWKHGRPHGLFYQFGGGTNSGGLPQWRCMNIEELSRVEIVNGAWHTSTGHSRPQTCVDDIDAEVTL